MIWCHVDQGRQREVANAVFAAAILVVSLSIFILSLALAFFIPQDATAPAVVHPSLLAVDTAPPLSGDLVTTAPALVAEATATLVADYANGGDPQDVYHDRGWGNTSIPLFIC